MTVIRVVPNLPVADLDRARDLYTSLFGLEVAMDLGWVANMRPGGRPDVQLQVMTRDAGAAQNPPTSIGVATPADVDAAYERVVAAGLEIVHPLGDEAWGVRRFFFRDLDGNVVNVIANH